MFEPHQWVIVIGLCWICLFMGAVGGFLLCSLVMVGAQADKHERKKHA